MNRLQSIRGFSDIQENIDLWQTIERVLKKTAFQYGYDEIRTPLLEDSRLFERSIGATSDIVHKEMYTFQDKNEQSISLRPEGTASVVRACIENNLLYDQARKFFYIGSMFRRERPQKGRLRQFNQFGMEALGYQEPYADIEQLLAIHRIWKTLGVEKKIALEMNYIGTSKTRKLYKEKLKAYYKPYLCSMSEIDKKRWEENTLRLLDSKDKEIIAINQEAPSIDEFYSDDEKLIFEEIQRNCKENGITFKVNHRLMRGLDYYCGLIYEWKSDELGAQSTVCGGGRYDGLFEDLGDKVQGACGYSIGIERLLEIIKSGSIQTTKKKSVHILVPDKKTLSNAVKLAEEIREKSPNISCYTHVENGKLGQLIKKALKKQASAVIICGEREVAENKYTLKILETQEQLQLTTSEMINKIGETCD